MIHSHLERVLVTGHDWDHTLVGKGETKDWTGQGSGKKLCSVYEGKGEAIRRDVLSRPEGPRVSPGPSTT